jgi:hypothetical protein
MQDFLNNAILTPLQNLVTQIYAFLPNFFAMLLILIMGFIVGFLAKRVLILFLKLVKFDRLSFRIGFNNLLSKAGIRHTASEVFGVFIYWILFFVFIMLALNALKVQALDILISQFFLFVPKLFAGLLIFFVGYLISVFIERAVLIAAVNAELHFARALARGAQLLALVFFLAIALEQLGIGRNIVIAAFSLIFGGIVLAIALALGLGGRELGREWLEKQFGKKDKGTEEKKDMWSHL